MIANLFPKLLASGKLSYENLLNHCGPAMAPKIPKEGLYFLIMPKYEIDLESVLANHRRRMRLD